MSTHHLAENTQQHLNHIDLYNAQVQKYLSENTLSPIQQEAIKIFKRNAQQNKLTDADYNKAVEQFNKSTGFILRKRGVSYVNADIDKRYSYINYPYIDAEAYRETMRNYRQFVHEYNNQAIAYNKNVSLYNSNFTSTKNETLVKEIKDFKAKYNRLFSRKYNSKVIAFNEAKGKVFIKKKNIQTIKYGTELFFSVILGFYTKQLRQYTVTQHKLGLPTGMDKNSLKRVEIDHRKLATHKIDDIPRLGICKRTAQNHVKRLREAGLLTHYVFSNQFNAIKVCINSKILIVLDGNLPKQQNTEKQLVNSVNGKDLHHNSDTIRTLLKEKKKKSDVFNIGSLISGSIQETMKTIPAVSYKNTRGKSQKTDSQNVSQKISKNARKLIQDDVQFAKDLTNKIYDNHTVLRYERLNKAIMYSDLSSVEFKKLLVHDLIKQSSKIWKNHTVYEGEWKRTITILNENLFKNITTKEQMLIKLREYRWKINFARKWFQKNSVNALFPYDYFDNTRKTTAEIGFYGLHYAWKTHLNYCEKRKKAHKQRQIEANKRKRRINNTKKYQNILQKYFAGKVNFEKMYDYINHNLPKQYMDQLEISFKNYNYTA